MRVLICGSRMYEDTDRVIEALVAGLGIVADNYYQKFVLIEGEAPGADTLARKAFEEYDGTESWSEVVGKFDYSSGRKYFDTELLKFPADWDKYGRSAGPIRNKQMLDEGKPTLVIAFADDLTTSRGTANMVKQAKEAGVPTYVVSRA